MGIAIYVIVELMLAAISALGFYNDNMLIGIIFLVLFVIGLIPVFKDNIGDVFDAFT